MEFLSLYIDRYYIIGNIVSAEITDDGSYNLCGYKPLHLSNSEDRIWLYFFEDVSADMITYGLSNKIHCDNKELHYFEGSVFDNIVNKYSQYKLRGVSKDMSSIFEDSKIFEDLKSGFNNKRYIETYVSYSNDIPVSAKKLFNELLIKNGFVLKQYIARIEELTKEKLCHKEDYVIVLSACDENLNILLFDRGLTSTKQLKGKGLDLRQKALVKLAVSNINKTAHVLRSQDEIDDEIIRLMPYSKIWLTKLDSSSMPIKLDIAFAVDPNTIHSPQLKKIDVEGYTRDLIKELSSYIHEYVAKNDVDEHQIQRVILIGEIFNNDSFRQEVLSKYSCAYNCVSVSDLPSIVSYYTQMDCSKYETENTAFVTRAKKDLEEKHKNQELQLRKEQISLQSKEKRDLAIAQAEARKQFESFKNKYKEAARELRWKEAIDFAEKTKLALDKKDLEFSSEIAYIDGDIDEYRKKLSEQEYKFEIFKKEIKLAREFFDNQNWEDAIKHADKALDANPEAEDAKRYIVESRKKIAEKGKIKEYITRATLLLGQKNYAEALEEVEDGLKLERANDELLSLKNEITLKENDFNVNVEKLSGRLESAILNKELDLALNIIAELIEFDNAHSAKWFDKKNEVRELIRDKEQFENKLKVIKSDIDLAYKLKQWEKVLSLCSNYLSNKDDSEVAKIKRESEARIEEINQTNKIVDLFEEIDSLISEKKYSIAEKKVKFLQSEYPEERDRCKKLLGKIFELEDEEDRRKRPHVPNSNGDFETESCKVTHEKAPKNQKKTDDDFDFEIKPVKVSQEKKLNSRKKSDDDFNF